jgi:hypothetical protein
VLCVLSAAEKLDWKVGEPGDCRLSGCRLSGGKWLLVAGCCLMLSILAGCFFVLAICLVAV